MKSTEQAGNRKGIKWERVGMRGNHKHKLKSLSVFITSDLDCFAKPQALHHTHLDQRLEKLKANPGKVGKLQAQLQLVSPQIKTCVS